MARIFKLEEATVMDLFLFSIFYLCEIEATAMPDEYRYKVSILCNDCSSMSEVFYHIFGHKCSQCSSYNTRIVSRVDGQQETAPFHITCQVKPDKIDDVPFSCSEVFIDHISSSVLASGCVWIASLDALSYVMMQVCVRITLYFE
ncbi:hypothetical protein V2J09_016133 [Rumex salicifolius]